MRGKQLKVPTLYPEVGCRFLTHTCPVTRYPGISEDMEGRKRSEKRPRLRQVSSGSSDSDLNLEQTDEFQILDQIDSSESEVEILSEALDSKTMDKLILMVRKTLEISEDLPKVDASAKHLADLNKQKLSFPLHRTIKDLITSEWEKSDKRVPILNRVTRPYPLEEDISKRWVARRTTLSLDSSASLQEHIDKKLDSNLSKIYTAAGASCHPTVALTTVSRAMKSWIRDLDSEVEIGVKRANLCDAIWDQLTSSLKHPWIL
ncbi:Hypothetical predicted protein [Pelobates cultripes]|uniref:Uncharacterized protein n=1 Tax=Pelobates cultripes TaxID=61616 RepID=A0AAD1VKP3_PELCU|nr:Hypothetical predicted protein [Pelobates cultripes]